MNSRRRPPQLLAVACALAALVPSVAAAAPSTIRNPAFWVPNGRVFDIELGAGRVYLGGLFNVIGPFTGPAAVLDSTSGAHSPGFPLINGNQIYAAAPDGSGGWYVGGSFDRVGGQTRVGLAHVLADGSVAPGFAPQVVGDVRALALDGSDLYVGGDITAIGATTRNGLAKLNASTGALDATWNPSVTGAAGEVKALVVSGAGLYVGGNFDQVGGQPRSDLALLSKTGAGAADTTFVSDV